MLIETRDMKQAVNRRRAVIAAGNPATAGGVLLLRM
jgi:hypothetical protein